MRGGALLALLFAAAPAWTELAWTEPAWAEPASPPVVVELFTSQSCYSCPAAEAYLGELARRPGIIALEWHVSYWNELVYGKAGRWVDPFSAPAFTERQRAYARALGRGREIYTPQMVIGGRREAVGSDRNAVEQRISEARSDRRLAATITPGEADGRLHVRIDGPASGGTVWLVSYLDRRATDVKGGENQGKRLDNHHIVTALAALGRHDDATARFAFEPPKRGEGCAILVQEERLGPVLAAAPCGPIPSPDAVHR